MKSRTPFALHFREVIPREIDPPFTRRFQPCQKVKQSAFPRSAFALDPDESNPWQRQVYMPEDKSLFLALFIGLSDVARLDECSHMPPLFLYTAKGEIIKNVLKAPVL